MLWRYFADGKLREQSDQAGLRSSYAYDLNGNRTAVTEALGAGNPSTALPVTVSAEYDALDQLAKVRVPKPNSPNYWATLFGYDQHGNATQLVQNQEELGRSYRDTVLLDSPLVYWRLGESSGTTATGVDPLSLTPSRLGLQASERSGGASNTTAVSARVSS